MLFFVTWYFLVSLVGLVALPLAHRLLPALADRGYAFSRSLGLLLWGYIFWLLASLGILRNDGIGLTFALAFVLLLSIMSLYSTGVKQFTAWLRSNIKYILGVEILFLLAFGLWAVVRAYNPEATGTEKPMELAFINAISRSQTLPPNDPWLSGYAISYYYFGYVLTAMLAGLTSVPGSVAFNLGISLVFALSAVGAFGLVNNLLSAGRVIPSNQVRAGGIKFFFSSMLGPLFLLFVSNLEGFLHSLHNRGLFWIADDNGTLKSPFWVWLDIKDLNLPPTGELSWLPTRFWWWWRASRVIQDYDLAGNAKEIIDEFPFFSFLLADLHPHVLAMPFALLALGFALNLLLGGSRGEVFWSRFKLRLDVILWSGLGMILLGIYLIWSSLASLSMIVGFAGIALILLSVTAVIFNRNKIRIYKWRAWFSPGTYPITIGTTLKLEPLALIFAAFIMGAIAFLNTWDMLLFVMLIPGGYALGRLISDRIKITHAVKEFFWMAGITITGAIILYLPFFISFSSQAGGIIPNLIYPTRGAHLWVMFAPLLVPIFALLLYLTFSYRDYRKNWNFLTRALRFSVIFLFILWVVHLAFGITAAFIPEVNQLFFSTLAAEDLSSLLSAAFTRRLFSPGALITLGGLLILSLGMLLAFDKTISSDNGAGKEPGANSPPNFLSNAFSVLLIISGVLLVLGPEFFYIRDQFGWRMNTIFKFYFQTWLVWSIAAAYGSATLLKHLSKPWSLVFGVALTAIVAMSLVYPVFSLWNKTAGFTSSQPTLDSTAYLDSSSPDELAAAIWLKEAQTGVIAEAVSYTGGSYTNYARMSTLSGIPAVLGWTGHESQWRGGSEEMGTRQLDIEKLYCSRNWQETKQILDRYKISYVVVGSLERTTYESSQTNCPAGLNESKFRSNLLPVFQHGSITIYQYAGG